MLCGFVSCAIFRPPFVTNETEEMKNGKQVLV